MLRINKMLHWWTQCNVRSVMFMLYFSPVPDHLRTKYEPEVEDKESVLSATASNMSSESTQVYRGIRANSEQSDTIFIFIIFRLFQRQIADFNATLSNLVEMIGTARDEWETDQSSGW